MIEQLAYLNDPLTFEFEAKVVGKAESQAGCDIILDHTYFYPTGGGQIHDTGTLNGVNVLDVFKDGEGNAVHRLDRDVSGPKLKGIIDHDRRLGNMQHHSAQHILSRAFDELFSLETLSAHISASTPSTIDLPVTHISQADMDDIEVFVNGLLFENRAIKSYFISDDEIHTVPFRRPPKVRGQIRVVEVEDFDYSACGGTHCPQTGMIGLIKILKTETRNKKLRVQFVAGHQALAYVQREHHTLTDLNRILNTRPEEMVNIVAGQIEQLKQARAELKALRAELLPLEANRLVGQAEPVGQSRLVTAAVIDRTAPELRELGKRLQQERQVIAVLAGFDGKKLSLVISCGDDTGVSARKLLAKQLALLDGRGGGDDKLAQGGGPATAAQMGIFFDPTKRYISELS